MGALFGISSKSNAGETVISQAYVRAFAAVKMAIDQVNNKTDGNYDGLLKNTPVCHKIFCVAIKSDVDVDIAIIIHLSSHSFPADRIVAPGRQVPSGPDDGRGLKPLQKRLRWLHWPDVFWTNNCSRYLAVTVINESRNSRL